MTSRENGFNTEEHYSHRTGYSLLPLRFLRLDEGRYVITNLAGEHFVISDHSLRNLIQKKLKPEDRILTELESRHLVTRGLADVHLELLAAQVRSRQSLLPEFTALHIFVVTLRCDQSCQYCQVSRVSEDRTSYDMSEEAADKAVDLMLRSPARQLKIEFQGGESLLNFPLIRHIVTQVEQRAVNREIAFVVATNLSPLTDEMLEFFASHRVFISTSLDGPADLHNLNRPRPEKDSYERTVEGIARCRRRLGQDSVSALMTCSVASLEQPEAIVDEYVRQGFAEIFLREISPYGFAARSSSRVGYATEKFMVFYKRGLARVLQLNRGGVAIKELYTTLVLQRMQTAYPTGYVDLQSPAGAGRSVLVYNYDGDIYASDEGRMLAAMGDTTFRLGNVHRSTWDDLFLESPMLDIAYRTMTEGLPGCSECAFQPWCGSDPVRHHAIQGDMIGHRPTSAFCRRNMEIMRHVVRILEDDPAAARILRRWTR